MTDIHQHLAELIKNSGARRDAELDKVSGDVSRKLDAADDGTSPATTGERAAENRSDAGAYTAATVDGGAKTNPVNASVTAATDGSSAGTDQHGAKGAVLTPVKDADNGRERPENKIAAVQAVLAEVKGFVQELRKQSAALVVVTKKDSGDSGEPTSDDGDDKGACDEEYEKEASALSPFNRFLANAARNSSDPGLQKLSSTLRPAELAKRAAEEMLADLESGAIDESAAADILAGAEEQGALGGEDIDAAGNAAAEELMQAIESGQVSEEDAAAILDDLMSSGAVSEDDLAAADAMMAEDMAGEGAPMGGDPMGGDPMGGADAGVVGEPTPEDMAAAEELAGGDVADALVDGGMDPKIASLLAVGPGDPRYLQKLELLYPEAANAGAAAFGKLAGDLLKSSEADENPAATEGTLPEAAPDTNIAAGADGQPGGPAATTALADSIPTETTTDKIAREQLSAELGIEPAALDALLSVQKVAASTDPVEAHKDVLRAQLLKNSVAAAAQQA